MSLKEYYEQNRQYSKLHVQNVLRYGATLPFAYPTMLPEQKSRIDYIKSHAAGEVLDIGTDSGYILAQCGGGIGLDISRERLGAARYYYPNSDYMQATAEHLPFREHFDTVVMGELFEHVLDPEIVIREAVKVLKEGGRLIITVPDEIEGQSHMNPEHLRKFTLGALKNLLMQHADITDTQRIEGTYPSWCITAQKAN